MKYYSKSKEVFQKSSEILSAGGVGPLLAPKNPWVSVQAIKNPRLPCTMSIKIIFYHHREEVFQSMTLFSIQQQCRRIMRRLRDDKQCLYFSTLEQRTHELCFYVRRPQVKYATAMDVFIVLCFFSVFMALVEFALINFIDTLIKNRKKKEAEKEERAKQRVEKAKVN